LYAEIDSDLFRSVVENLLGNALQYTQYGSIQVILDGPDDADNALIKVADTGIGIPAASINTVFRRFVRLPAAQALRAEGLGVGLSLVRKIVELHGAAITVQSTEGRGSEFSITWPVLLLGMQNDKYIDMNKPGISQYAGLDGSSTSSSIQYSVLVVEDDPDLLDYLSTRLADAFYVQTAQSANLALERLESGYIPDIIISDIMMPGMDGIQFFENIRSEQEYASIPFLFLTARDLESEKLSLIEQGAVDYITKPFSMDLLIARINMILSLKAPDRDEYITQVTQRCHERGLSERQTEIVHLLLQGRSKKDIAACLKPIRGKNGGQGISVKTVDNHVQKLYEAFGVHSQYELMALFTPAVREASSDSVANKNS
jgi:DNA-binding NarL/FixJ family response regulator